MRFRLVCAGCGNSPHRDDALPFRCANAGAGDVDHVMQRVPEDPLDGHAPELEEARLSTEPNPFIRFRALTFPHAFALAQGISDGDYVELVRRLDAAVERVDGRGFRVTPLVERDGLYIKDETGNVGGSHKGRHLMGIALQLEVAARLGRRLPAPLAIASCGNAALAAAVVARAAGRALEVFVPTSADASVVDRLRALGAEVTTCARQAGVAGDPSYLAFRAAVGAGALPFTCQGGDNALALDGGRTLGYELALQLAGRPLDRLFVQVGGGALASALFSALRESLALGWLPRLPQCRAVQTRGGWPLARAWERFTAHAEGESLVERLRWAATHRSQLMWPWEEEPRSIAHGILDDETYDWLAVVGGLAASGGGTVVVDEETLERANRLGVELGFNVDATGSAGLAGLLASEPRGTLHSAVLFTGAGRRI
jgi:threonine synthase